MVDIDYRKKLIADLNTAYLNDELVIFIGAGLSIPIGLPGWKSLIEDIYTHYRIEIPEENTDFWKSLDNLQANGIYANDLKNYISNLIKDYISYNKDSIENRECNNYFDIDRPHLFKIFSTNFDTIPPKIIHGLNTVNLLALHGTSLADTLSRSEKTIIYLHGNINEPDTIIVKEEDVKKIYNDVAWKNAFISALSTFHVLFIGMSFADSYMRDFMQNIMSHNNNNYAVITFDELSNIPPERQIKLTNIYGEVERISKIRSVLDQVFSDFTEVVFIRVPQSIRANEIRNKLQLEFDIRGNSTLVNSVKQYQTIQVSLYGNKLSLQDTFEKIDNILTEDGTMVGDFPIIYISQDSKNIQVATNGKAKKSYFDKIHALLSDCIKQKSIAYMIDNTSKVAKTPSDNGFFAALIEKRIDGSFGKHSVLTSSTFEGGAVTGIEVHVAGIVFSNNKVLVEKRKSDEANIPDKYSLPGGRVHRGEMFSDAMHRKLSDIGFSTRLPLCLINEYKVIGTNAPGLFYLTVSDADDIKINRDFGYLDRKKLLDLCEQGLFACDVNIISYILARLKPTIKLRIVMLNDCNFKCKLCHHENIVKNEEQNIELIQTTLMNLEKGFNISQITITGGEPLIPNNISSLEKLLSYIRIRFPDTNISIITNAHFLSEEIAKKLAVYNVRYKLSLYGSTNKSVEDYTCSNDIGANYFKDFVQKLCILGELGINITINIPLHKTILEDYSSIFSDAEFAACVKKYKVKIKIIEMVKSITVESSCFSSNFVPVSELEKDTTISGVDAEHFNADEILINSIRVSLYRYPCYDTDKCNDCFSEFALTLKPNGELLICERAKEKAQINDTIFDDICIEYIDYKVAYNL